jgi:protein-cysteine N-palmitoyltransferase HHAT
MALIVLVFSCIQLSRPKGITPRATARYALRFLISFLTMETLIHVMHVVSIKDAHAWSDMNPAQLSMVGFWNLIFVWLKVCLPILH